MSSLVSQRLVESMAPEVQQLIYSPRLTQEISASFTHVVDINQAHAIMLAERGIITPEVAHALAAALLEIERHGSSIITADPAREDVHFNFEATLIARTSAEIGGRIHIGRSRNDMGATIDRMRARQACLDVEANLNALRAALLRQAKAYAGVVMSGYTHLRPAQPITFGFYLLGIASAMERDCRRIRSAYDTINESPMGAAAFSGTSFEIDRERVATLLGFPTLVEHALDAVASRDFLLELAGACTDLGITWSRLAQDLYVWSTDEFGLITFSDHVSGTSSIMPQKKNPVVMEYLKSTGAENIGSLVSMLSTMRASHFTNSIDGVRSSTAGAWQILETTRHSLVVSRLMIDSCTPNRDNMLRQAERNFSTLTDVADLLVRECGISFREAHHIAGAAVRIALERGLDSRDIDRDVLESAAQAILGRRLGVSVELALICGDPAKSILERKSRGGPSPSEIERIQQRVAEQLRADEASLRSRIESQNESRRMLKKTIAALAQP
jgi:argininosuccinate lyase